MLPTTAAGPIAPDSADGDPVPAGTVGPLTLGEAAGLATVTTVAAIGTVSLALAQLSWHEGVLAVALGLVVAAGFAGVAFAVLGRPSVKVDWQELAVLALVLVVALWFFLPGFHYTSVDKDPGVYVAHAFVIARDGGTTVSDPVVEQGIEPTNDQAGRFPGFWVESADGTLTSQFYHYYSALLATAKDIGGARALFNFNPVLAAISVALLTMAVRRAFGTLTAAVGAALLVTSMMQVWQAKYPSTEITAQFLFVGAALGGVIATSRRSASAASSCAALVSGLCLGVGFLARPDGFLYMLVGAAVAAVAVAMGRADRRLVAFGAGLAVTAPYAFYNAYVVRDDYSSTNDVPHPLLVLAALALIVGAGGAARGALEGLKRRNPFLVGAATRRLVTSQRALGAGLAVATGVVLLALYHRESLFGMAYEVNAFSGGQVVRSYNERNMVWLSWYFSRLGLVVMWAGLCVVALQRWRAPRWLLVVPGLAFLPIYVYDARVSMRLMWWVRRFVPAVAPTIILLMAVAVAWAIGNRMRQRSVSLAIRLTGVVLLFTFLLRFTDQSLPLRSHDEMDGSWDTAAAIAANAGGDDAVFLYPQPPEGDILHPIRNMPGAVWWVFDQLGARLPEDYDLTDIEQYRDAFPDRPIYLVTEGSSLPPGLPPDRFEPKSQVVDDLTFWDERLDTRPTQALTRQTGLSVWRLTD